MTFPLLDIEVAACEPLKDGTSNDTYLINARYVYRKKKESDFPFFSPLQEEAILKRIQVIGIAPKQIAYDVKTGDKVEGYLSDARFFDGSIEDLKLYAALLKKLHSLPSDGIAPFSVKERYDYYKTKSQEDLGEGDLYNKIAPLLEGKQVICHNDLWQGNMLIKNGKPYLIDFEFAGANSPVFDLASTLSENKITDKDRIEIFLREYFGKEDIEKEYQSVKRVMKFEDALWFYWAKCRYIGTGKEHFLEIMKNKEMAYINNR